jgi:hypothetical protein
MLGLLRFFFVLILTLSAFSIESLACSCGSFPVRAGMTLEEIRKERRNYFQNEFKGAAFIGKIAKRELVRIDRNTKTDGDEADQYEFYYRYTIRVREHWFGVSSESIYVYGEPESYPIYNGVLRGSTSCGFKLEKGRTYFFTPELFKNDLHINQCDFAGAGSGLNDYPATEFRKIMGEPKRF